VCNPSLGELQVQDPTDAWTEPSKVMGWMGKPQCAQEVAPGVLVLTLRDLVSSLLGFRPSWGLILLSSCLVLPFGVEVTACACPTTLFLEVDSLFWLHRLTAGGLCLRMNCVLSLIHI
jgi:hypothetical protein